MLQLCPQVQMAWDTPSTKNRYRWFKNQSRPYHGAQSRKNIDTLIFLFPRERKIFTHDGGNLKFSFSKKISWSRYSLFFYILVHCIIRRNNRATPVVFHNKWSDRFNYVKIRQLIADKKMYKCSRLTGFVCWSIIFIT